MEILDITCKIATTLIAIANVILVIIIFRRNNKRELLKVLVLDYGIKHFYAFFEDIDKETAKLKNKDITDDEKKDIEKKLQLVGKTTEQKFVDLFLGTDKKLHEDLKHNIDDLLGDLTQSIFDEGVNLYAKDKFDDLITNKIIIKKSKMIKLLYEKFK